MGCCMSAEAVVNPPKVKSSEKSKYVYVAGEAFSGSTADYEAPIRYAESGAACVQECETMTLPELLKKAAAKDGNKVAMRVERDAAGQAPEAIGVGNAPAMPADQWTTWTYNEYQDECRKVACAFMSVGVEQFDSVAIFGFNAPEWIMAAMSSILCGGKSAGIYPTDTAEQIKYKCLHSGAKVMVLEDQHNLEKFKEVAAELPLLTHVVVWNEKGLDPQRECMGKTVVTWKELVAMGNDVATTQDLDARQAKIRPGHCCALIYTSGTTGNPKAVMISHDNIYFESCTVVSLLNKVVGNGKDIDGNDDLQERIISYLPLSHVAGMMVDIVCPVVITANTVSHLTMSFARPYDLKKSTIRDRLEAVKPTLFLGVPRVWEKIAETMKKAGAQITGVKKKVSTWAKAKGLVHAQNMNLGGSGAYPCCYGFASKKIHALAKQRLGLDKCKFGMTGAAPIMPETLEYFGQLGISINEVYGMSECTGATTWSLNETHLWGSCGFAMPGTEVVIMDLEGNILEEPGAEGELCYRGRHIMMGYLANPALGEEHVKEIVGKTSEAIDDQGWLHSGDKGCKDSLGMFKITGRYKELIIGAGGENVAPVPIENFLKTHVDPETTRTFGISDVMMVGDKRKYNTALITLCAEGHTGELAGNGVLTGDAQKVNPACKTIEEAMTDEVWHTHLTNAIKQVNDSKACASNAAKIQKFKILPTNFSVEGDEFTPTLKLKRSLVSDKYKSYIDAMY